MYTPALIHAYKQSRSGLPINTWVNVVGRRLPQFRNESDIFQPIPLQVKIAGSLNDSNGAVLMSVNPTDKNWYTDLTSALEDMTGSRGIQVVNYLGESIENKTTQELMHTGECECVIKSTGTPLRLANVVAPPLHMSTNKQAALKEWWNSIRGPLAETVAAQLKDLSMSEIAQATVVDGPVQETIEHFFESHTLHDMPWEKFVATYGSGYHQTTVEAMGRKILDAVRQSLVANEKQVRTHHASVGTEAALWKSTIAGVTSRYKDAFSLYRDIIEDATYHPLVGQQMVQGIVYGTTEIGARAAKKGKKKTLVKSEYHPVSAYYQQHHFTTHGKLPGHRIQDLNIGKNVNEDYPGDINRAVDMFNLFSGRATRPRVVADKLISVGEAIERVQGHYKKKEKKERPVDARMMPELIPIQGHYKKKEKKEKEQRPVDARMMPELIPIQGHYKKKEKKEKEQRPVDARMMPELIPIQQEMPRLIPLDPIACGTCGGGKKKNDSKKHSRVEGQLPRLIPIDARFRERNAPMMVPAREDLTEHIWVDDLPGLADFL